MAAELSVLITCKNERKNIRACIESVRDIAAEIVVADNGSTDDTLAIVRQIGDCRIIAREQYVSSGNFKNWAIPQCTHPWVLILDCDERVTPALAEEIQRVLELDGPLDGYWIYRENYWLGRKVSYSGWGGDKVIRLFRRDLGRYNEYTDHSEMEIAGGRVGQLSQRMRHYGVWSLDTYLPRVMRYAGQQAEIWKQQGRRPSAVRMFLTGVFRFLHAYIIRGGFLDGAAGLQISLLTGFYSFYKQAKLWELYHALPEPDDATPRCPQPAVLEHATRAKQVA